MHMKSNSIRKSWPLLSCVWVYPLSEAFWWNVHAHTCWPLHRWTCQSAWWRQLQKLRAAIQNWLPPSCSFCKNRWENHSSGTFPQSWMVRESLVWDRTSKLDMEQVREPLMWTLPQSWIWSTWESQSYGTLPQSWIWSRWESHSCGTIPKAGCENLFILSRTFSSGGSEEEVLFPALWNPLQEAPTALWHWWPCNWCEHV